MPPPGASRIKTTYDLPWGNWENRHYNFLGVLSGHLYPATLKQYYKEYLTLWYFQVLGFKMVIAGMASSNSLNMATSILKKEWTKNPTLPIQKTPKETQQQQNPWLMEENYKLSVFTAPAKYNMLLRLLSFFLKQNTSRNVGLYEWFLNFVLHYYWASLPRLRDSCFLILFQLLESENLDLSISLLLPCLNLHLLLRSPDSGILCGIVYFSFSHTHTKKDLCIFIYTLIYIYIVLEFCLPS